jgi:hypothetical protein
MLFPILSFLESSPLAVVNSVSTIIFATMMTLDRMAAKGAKKALVSNAVIKT